MTPKCAIRLALITALFAVAAQAWAEPFGFSINSRGNFVDNQMVNALWRVNLITGESEYIGWTSFLDVEGIAFDDQDRLFGADDESGTLIRIGTQSGMGFAVGGLPHNMGVPIDQIYDFGMTFTCDNTLLIVAGARQSLYLGNVDTGSLTLLGAEGALGVPIADIAARGDQVYGIGRGMNAAGQPLAPNLYRIHLDPVGAELIGPLGGQAAGYFGAGLSFDADGLLWAITDRRDVPGGDFPSEVLRINPATGQATRIADTGIVGHESLAILGADACGLAGGPEPGPEDESLIIPTLGGGGLLAMILLLALIGLARLKIGPN